MLDRINFINQTAPSSHHRPVRHLRVLDISCVQYSTCTGAGTTLVLRLQYCTVNMYSTAHVYVQYKYLQRYSTNGTVQISGAWRVCHSARLCQGSDPMAPPLRDTSLALFSSAPALIFPSLSPIPRNVACEAHRNFSRFPLRCAIPPFRHLPSTVLYCTVSHAMHALLSPLSPSSSDCSCARARAPIPITLPLPLGTPNQLRVQDTGNAY